ncbi:vitamin K epoxide reductase family protein [Ferruginibacter profundus]
MMFAQYQPNIKAAITYLKLLKVSVNNTTVNETLQNHPDWPSLLCITDSLNKWNVPNAAGKVELGRIDELPVPFMAYTNDRENPLAIVTDVTDSVISLYQKKYKKRGEMPKDDFFKIWNGVYVIAEPDEHSGEQNFKQQKIKSISNLLAPVSAIIGLAIFSFFLLNKDTDKSLLVNITFFYLQYVVLLVGIFVTSILLWYEIDKSNPLLQKVCSGIAKGNCNAILTGKQAKVFKWLSWSEVGFFYFTGGLGVLLFCERPLTILAWLSILALPYTVFSVYYQWRVAKQWCILCLAVQALLLCGGINVVVNKFFYPVQSSFLLIINTLMFYMLPALLWFTVKPYVLRLQAAKSTKREYLRLKFNGEIFDTLLNKQKQITLSTDGLGIDIGNPAATNTIIKVCNPYCGPCAKAHPKIEALIEANNNVKAKIIFTTANDETNPAIKPVRHLLAVAAENNPEKIKAALDDWYLPEKKEYEIFEKKYRMNGELLKQGEKIAAMEKWCKATDIAFTPTIFINGKQLPDAYSIEDLQYFLLE